MLFLFYLRAFVLRGGDGERTAPFLHCWWLDGVLSLQAGRWWPREWILPFGGWRWETILPWDFAIGFLIDTLTVLWLIWQLPLWVFLVFLDSNWWISLNRHDSVAFLLMFQLKCIQSQKFVKLVLADPITPWVFPFLLKEVWFRLELNSGCWGLVLLLCASLNAEIWVSWSDRASCRLHLSIEIEHVLWGHKRLQIPALYTSELITRLLTVSFLLEACPHHSGRRLPRRQS